MGWGNVKAEEVCEQGDLKANIGCEVQLCEVLYYCSVQSNRSGGGLWHSMPCSLAWAFLSLLALSLLPALHRMSADLHELFNSGPPEVAALFSACTKGPFSWHCKWMILPRASS